jgi:sialidase-1
MASDSGEISMVVCPASPRHCRQTEASILPFDDGRLYLAYTDFYGGDWHDRGPARIMARWSHDEGHTWSAPMLVQENIGRLNVMEASLLRLPSGRVLLCFMRKDSEGDAGEPPALLHCLLRYSDDGCRTWSDLRQITTEDAYWCSTNDRLLRLSGGRILLSVGEEKAGCHVWYSDDDGGTWRKSSGLMPPPGKRYAEPTVVELANGVVAMFIRTDTTCIHIGHSRDGGETWRMHNDWGPFSPYAPCMVRRVPDSPDLLLIWNNHGTRSNLTSAISRDHGETWDNYRLLEEQEGWPLPRSHTYPSLAFLRGNAHMTYWETHKHPQVERLFHLVYRRLPVSWFYERPRRRPPVYDVNKGELSAKAVYDGEEREDSPKRAS